MIALGARGTGAGQVFPAARHRRRSRSACDLAPSQSFAVRPWPRRWSFHQSYGPGIVGRPVPEEACVCVPLQVVWCRGRLLRSGCCRGQGHRVDCVRNVPGGSRVDRGFDKASGTSSSWRIGSAVHDGSFHDVGWPPPQESDLFGLLSNQVQSDVEFGSGVLPASQVDSARQ